MKKGLILGLTAAAVGCCLLVGGCFVLVFTLTRGPVEAADRFLALLGQDKVQQAYRSAADAFRAATDEERFTAAVRRWQLTDFRSSFWSNRRVENHRGSVEGTVTTRGGAVIPLKVE